MAINLGYAVLASAIITRAKKDLKKNPDDYGAKKFLRSKWYGQLETLCAIGFEDITKDNTNKITNYLK